MTLIGPLSGTGGAAVDHLVLFAFDEFAGDIDRGRSEQSIAADHDNDQCDARDHGIADRDQALIWFRLAQRCATPLSGNERASVAFRAGVPKRGS